MSRQRWYIGVDGCPGGWFCVALRGNQSWSISLETTDSLVRLGAAATRLFIDIPIGLPDAAAPTRVCDREARRILGRPRASSVFPVPARDTLSAPDYRQALMVNRRVTGRGLSKQAWLIAPKIRQIDEVLQAKAALRRVMRESHPEVCFWALNDSCAMRHNKKTVAGRNERMCVLRRLFAGADAVLAKAAASYPRKLVALDDVVDALALALSARLGAKNHCSLPVKPPRDCIGLPIQIVYGVPGRRAV